MSDIATHGQAAENPLRDAAYLRRRYVDERASSTDIAAEHGVTSQAVRRALRRAGITVRRSGPRPKLAGIPGDELLEIVTRAGSIRAAASCLDVTYVTLRQHLLRLGCTTVVQELASTRAEARASRTEEVASVRAASARSRQDAKDALHAQIVDMYTARGMSINQIGAELGRDPSGIWRILVARGVQTDTARQQRDTTNRPARPTEPIVTDEGTTICPTCRQTVPGVAEPRNTGAIVSCTCGDVYLKLPSAPTVKGTWKRMAGRQSGRAFWITVLGRHSGDGHTLSVLRDGAPGDAE